MTKCKHQFFEVKKRFKYVPESPSNRVESEGAMVTCALCGEVRDVWETGEVIIKTHGKETSTTAGATE